MLRKRTRSHQKDQNMNNLTSDSELFFHSNISNQKHKNYSFLNVPGLFVGFNHKNSESESLRSPTSPLDFRIFSSLGNPFRCLRSQNEGHQKSWDCSKVGLSIIDSLDDEPNRTGNSVTAARSSDSKNIIFGRQMSVKSSTFCSHASSLQAPKSLPKNVAIFPSTLARPANPRRSDSDVVFEIGEAPIEPEICGSLRARSMDSGRYGSHLMDFVNRKSRLGGSGNFAFENTAMPVRSVHGIVGISPPKLESPDEEKLSSIPSIPASEIELSEDYTCVRTHGPNPKVTHIFGDCILECHSDDLSDFLKNSEGDNATTPYSSGDFLKFCYSCKKKLDGEDIYMYRGEKAFCSSGCRSQEIEIEEEAESNLCIEACSSNKKSGLFI